VNVLISLYLCLRQRNLETHAVKECVRNEVIEASGKPSVST
jgi:hypothetical protein